MQSLHIVRQDSWPTGNGGAAASLARLGGSLLLGQQLQEKGGGVRDIRCPTQFYETQDREFVYSPLFFGDILGPG